MMKLSVTQKIQLSVAALALVAYLGIQFFLLRSVPMQQQIGVVKKVDFFQKGTVERSELRGSRNKSGIKTSSYKLPARYIYTIELKDGTVVRFQENGFEFSGSDFQVADKLQVNYGQRLGILSAPNITVHRIKLVE